MPKAGGLHGYDGAKKLNGRRRHLLVDTLGLVCKVEVTAASEAVIYIRTTLGRCSKLR